VGTDSRGGDIAPEVLAVEQVVGMPRLTSETWAQVFQTLERYASTHAFNLTECTAWTRDQLAVEGTPVGRAALGWAVRGARYGGADLGNDPPPTALAIATGVYRNSVYLAQEAGLELTPDELDGFARHLGHEEAPSDER
jgi:hypothetical protein